MKSGVWSCVAACAAVALLGAPAGAFNFQARFVERVGTTDVPLGDTATFSAGSTHRLRIQFGAFDDGAGPAPVGGYIGWVVGTFNTTGGGTWSRTPGRLAPYNFFAASTANGVPETDPFTSLTQIDNAMGFQTIPWFCDDAGQPLPVPQAIVRGLNSFVSTYEVTVSIPSSPGTATYVTTIAGRLYASNAWTYEPTFGSPPDCETGTPGVAWWNPRPTAATQADFSYTFTINVVPAPASALGLLLFGALGRRRRAR